METKLQKIINNNRWIVSKIRDLKNITFPTIVKARKWENIHFWNKQKIYEALIEMNLITNEMTINDLFSEEKEIWEDNQETSMNLQEVI